jgi:hypothetical protein
MYYIYNINSRGGFFMEITVRELKERLEMFDENLQVVVEDAILGNTNLVGIDQVENRLVILIC